MRQEMNSHRAKIIVLRNTNFLAFGVLNFICAKFSRWHPIRDFFCDFVLRISFFEKDM